MSSSWDMPPSPISDREYHDAKLVRVEITSKGIELGLIDLSGAPATIILSDVRCFILSDFLEGNIVDYILCHTLTEENYEDMLKVFSGESGTMIDLRGRDARIKKAEWLGKRYLGLRSSYGAFLDAVASDVMER